jgi:ferredoxin
VYVLCRIDRTKCMGNQRCVSVAPDLFELGDAGYSRTRRADETDFTDEDLPRLLAAQDMCPTGAITIQTMAEDELETG